MFDSQGFVADRSRTCRGICRICRNRKADRDSAVSGPQYQLGLGTAQPSGPHAAVS